MHFRWILMSLFVLVSYLVRAQGRAELKKGNSSYRKGAYEAAIGHYKKSLEEKPGEFRAAFNLGNAIYQEKNFEQARSAMEFASKLASDKLQQSRTQYNIGNTFMEEQKWDEAIEEYKKVLRAHPQDEDARYNLSYALKKKKQQQQKKQQSSESSPEQNQDQSSQEKEQAQQKEDQPSQQQKRPQPQPSRLNKKQAEQLLQALQQEEKEIQERKRKAQSQSTPPEKDW